VNFCSFGRTKFPPFFSPVTTPLTSAMTDRDEVSCLVHAFQTGRQQTNDQPPRPVLSHIITSLL